MKDNRKLKLFEDIKDLPAERKYFFRKLGSAEQPWEWFEIIKDQGLFNPANNPEPIEDENNKGSYKIPYWEINDYLLNLAEKNKDKHNFEKTDELESIIDPILEYNIEKNIDNYHTDKIVLETTFLLPFSSYKFAYTKYINKAFHSRWDNALIVDLLSKKGLPYLLENYPKSEKHLKELTGYLFSYKRKKTFNLYEYYPLLYEYWFARIFDTYSTKIAEKLKIKGVELAEKIIYEILNEDNSQFSIICIPNIDSSSNTEQFHRYIKYLVYFLRDCIDKLDDSLMQQKISDYLNKEHYIFIRIAFYFIDKYYEQLKDLFWGLRRNPLEILLVRHELYPLLQNNAIKFKFDEISKCINWVELLKIDNEIDSEDEKNLILAYRKKEWYYALTASNDSRIKEKYSYYDKINSAPIKHPGRDFWMSETTFGNDRRSPSEKYCHKTVTDLVKELQKMSDKKGDLQRDDEALQILRNCVENNPEKYISESEKLVKLHPAFHYTYLRAIIDFWSSDKDKYVDWNQMFQFMELAFEIFDPKSIIETDSYEAWIIKAMAELIENGTKKDNHAFSLDLLPRAEKILLSLENLSLESAKIDDNLNFSMWNSPKFIIYSSIINYSLRYARNISKEEQNKFPENILIMFNVRLSQQKSPELYFAFGVFSANLLYLNRSWLIDNVNTIFFNYDRLREYSLSAYFNYTRSVDKELYLKFRDEGILDYAINKKFQDDEAEQGKIAQICISYFEGWERINRNDSMLKKVLKLNNSHYIDKINNFVWSIEERLNQGKYRPKVKTLLGNIVESIQGIKSKSEREDLLASLPPWLKFFNKFDAKLLEIFFEVSNYGSKNYDNEIFIKYLANYVDNQPDDVTNLLTNLIAHDNSSYGYTISNLENIFKVLKDKDLNNNIKQICKALMDKELIQYKELCKKYIELD